MCRSLARVSASLAMLFPAVALAHTGAGDAGGFAHGFFHPVAGIDHILAMVTVGIFAFQLRGRAVWLVPAAFVAVMAIGGALGVAGIDVPAVEIGIAVSVVVLGAAVAIGVRAPVAAAMALVGAFAVFHGHVHGAEMPENAAGLTYGIGFMLATATLHGLGVGLGFLVGKFAHTQGKLIHRVAGGAISLAGLVLLAGIF